MPHKKTIKTMDLVDLRMKKLKLIKERKAITTRIKKLNNVIATRVYESN